MTAPDAIRVWAIKAPDGKLNLISDNSKYGADFTHIFFDRPTYRLSEGYRCVRVTVQEMQE